MLKAFIFTFLVGLQLVFITKSFAWDVDLRNIQSPVKNQCDRNTCAYFSCTGLLESLIFVEFNRQVQLSEQYIIHLSKTKFENKVMQEHADPYHLLLQFERQSDFYYEKDIPYQKNYFSKGGPCEKYINKMHEAPAFCFSQFQFENLEPLQTVRVFGLKIDHMSQMWTSKSRSQIIMDTLDEKRSVVITAKIVPDKWKHKEGIAVHTQEIEEMCVTGELECFGHAILLVGYDKIKKEFLFKNSWGQDWGESGYGRISFDHVENFSESPYSLRFDRFLKDVK